MAQYYVFEIENNDSLEEIGSALYSSDDLSTCVEFATNWFTEQNLTRSIMVYEPAYNFVVGYWISPHYEKDENGNISQVRKLGEDD